MSVARVAVGIGGNLVGTLSGTTAPALAASAGSTRGVDCRCTSWWIAPMAGEDKTGKQKLDENANMFSC